MEVYRRQKQFFFFRNMSRQQLAQAISNWRRRSKVGSPGGNGPPSARVMHNFKIIINWYLNNLKEKKYINTIWKKYKCIPRGHTLTLNWCRTSENSGKLLRSNNRSQSENDLGVVLIFVSCPNLCFLITQNSKICAGLWLEYFYYKRESYKTKTLMTYK